MRVGLVCPYSLDIPGGVQNHVTDLAEALIGRGHDVSVLAPTESTGPRAVRRQRGAGRAGALQRRGRPACRSARSWRRAAALAARRASSTWCTCTSRPPRACRCSALWAAECRSWRRSTRPTRGRGRCRAAAAMLRPSLERIAARIAVSEHARDFSVQHIGGEPVVIPNGLYVDRFRNADPDAGVARSRRRRSLRRPDRRAAQGVRGARSTRSARWLPDRPGLRLLVVGGGRRRRGAGPAARGGRATR